MNEKQKEIARKIIYAVETGGQVYGKVRYDCYVGKNTNSTKETACTIGGAGNHAGTAKKLMQLILSTYPVVFRKYDTAGIESDLKKSWDNYDPGIGSKKAKCIQKIISTPEGIRCQDALLDQQMEARVKKAEEMGVSNLDAQLMCANIIHLGGNAALERVLKKTKKPYTLDNIFAALKTDQQDKSSDNQVGDTKYWSRHEKIYGWLKEKLSETGGSKVGTLNGLLKRAEAETGYIEKGSNSNLDSKTGNKGLNNYTKYSRDINNLGLAGCQGQPWCATFQFWLEVQEFGLAAALSHWHMSKSNYCGYSVFSTRDKFPTGKRSKTPKVGCLVVFKTSHIGRVISISGNKFSTIEGNTSSKPYDRNGGQVAKKTYSVTDSKIDCFLIMDYCSGNSTPTETVKQDFKSLYVGTGRKGMVVTTPLNKRTKPVSGTVKGTIAKGKSVFPTERTVAGTFPTWWFKVNGFWCSGKYLTGWVLDKTAGKWWYLENGSYPSSSWKKIDGVWYYFMQDGYMASDAYIKYKDHYCWVNKDGAWEPQWDTKTPNLSKYKLAK